MRNALRAAPLSGTCDNADLHNSQHSPENENLMPCVCTYEKGFPSFLSCLSRCAIFPKANYNPPPSSSQWTLVLLGGGGLCLPFFVLRGPGPSSLPTLRAFLFPFTLIFTHTHKIKLSWIEKGGMLVFVTTKKYLREAIHECMRFIWVHGFVSSLSKTKGKGPVAWPSS